MSFSKGALVLISEWHLPKEKREGEGALGIIENCQKISGNYFCAVKLVYPKSVSGDDLIKVACKDLFCVCTNAEPLTEDLLMKILFSMSHKVQRLQRKVDAHECRELDRQENCELFRV